MDIARGLKNKILQLLNKYIEIDISKAKMKLTKSDVYENN